MSERESGGPAFPTGFTDAEGSAQEGMSQRDWLAGQALNGMLAHARPYRPRNWTSTNWHEAIAQEAYQIADAMLAARSAA